MTLQHATLAVLCLTSLILAGGSLHRTGWPGTGAGHTVLFHEFRVGPVGLFGQTFAAVGAAHASAWVGDAIAAGDIHDAGFWGGYQGYLADPDGHVWSGKQR